MPATDPTGVWRVRIRTEDGERILDDAAIETFISIWQSKEKTGDKFVDVTSTEIESFWVESPTGGARWLCDHSGRVWVLAKNIVPIYKIPDAEAFNEIMGFQD